MAISSRDQIDLFLFFETSRGDLNETIVTEKGKGEEYRRSRCLTPTRRGSQSMAAIWRRRRPHRRLNIWTVTWRWQTCTQFVSSSDNYAIMPTFLPSRLALSALRIANSRSS